MKALVFSDSHGEKELMKSIILSQSPQMILHLGDNTADLKVIKAQFPDIDIRGVRGNCDLNADMKESLYLSIEDKTIFMTHGHAYNVKFGYDRIIYSAIEKKADIMLFGHTHRPYCDIVKGIHILNPGSIGKGSMRTYGIINIINGRIETMIQAPNAT